jgi:RsiW-degrading membrane proteinase PrsW (M82 family)
MFAPLLLVLRRWGSRLDVLACGAMIGLGFATEENLNYFAADAGTSAVGRFLTANFLHMSMTALCADALDHFLERPAERSMDFTVTFLTVVGLHGAYDFFAANPAVGELSFLSVMVFILLTRKFLGAVRQTRGRPDAQDRFLRRLVQAVAVVAGAGFVYACSEVGPVAAAALLAVGLLGDAIIIYVFVHETRET